MVVHYVLQWNTEQYFNTTLIRRTLYSPRSPEEGRGSLDSWPQNSANALSIPGVHVPAFKGQRARLSPASPGQPVPGTIGLCLSVSSTSQIFFKGLLGFKAATQSGSNSSRWMWGWDVENALEGKAGVAREGLWQSAYSCDPRWQGARVALLRE